MRVIIAGGGTGGHLYPGIAVAEKLHEKGVKTFFLVSDRGIERRVLSSLGYGFQEQDISAFMGEGIRGKAKSLAKLLKAANKAMRYIDEKDKVLLLGGFAAAPAALAAVLKGADLYMHEQNSVMGIVNRFMSFFSKRVFISYKDTLHAPKRSMLVGNPVRKSFEKGEIKKEAGKKILVLGGSGGSRVINTTFAKASKELLRLGYTIRHQTGEKLYDETVAEYEKFTKEKGDALKIEAYIDDMAQAYEEADIVVSRSGSGAVFETLNMRRPALYIPFAKAAGNHQYYNALRMEKEGVAKVLQESELTAETLSESVIEIYKNFENFNKNLKAAELLNSAELIVKKMGPYTRG